MTDGRLLGPAVSAWLAAAVVCWVVGPPSLADDMSRMAMVVVLIGALAAVGMVTRWRGLVAVLAVGALVGAGSAGVRLVALADPTVHTLVHTRASVDVQAVVDADARRRDPLPGSFAPALLEVRVTATKVVAREAAVEARLPLVLRADLGTVIPPAGTAVVVRGRLAPSGRLDAAGVLSAERIETVREPGAVDAVAGAMRAGLRRSLAHAPPVGAPLVAGLAVGDESMQSGELDDAMRASGLSHLTAVSGGNVAILLAVVLAIGTALRWRIATRVAVSLASLAFFVVLVRPEPSVVRAVVMGGVAVVAMLTGGRRASPSVLATAVLAVVVLAPLLAVSWGFALSAFATAGLVLLAPRLQAALLRGRRTRRWPPALREAVAITGAAQLATLPLLVAMGTAVGWVALPANLLAMPAVAPVTVLGLAAALVSPMAPWAAIVLSWLAAWPAAWIALVAQWSADLPLARLPWLDGWTGVGLLALVGVAVLVARRTSRHWRPRLPPNARLVLGVGAATLVVLLVVAPPGRRGWPPPDWLLVMCDVGQGEAVVVRSGPESVVVVDAGPVPALIDRCLDDLGVRTVDAVVLTHFHADHAMGLPGVGRGRTVRAAYVSSLDDPPEQAADAFAWFAGIGVVPQRPQLGSVLRIGEVTAQVLGPVHPVTGTSPNNASLVLAVQTGGSTLLLTGDIEAPAQRAAMSAARIDADVVTVPHHGSASVDADFVAWTGARVALVSVGEGNDYGHPAPSTIEAWRRQALVARTDESGDLAAVLLPDGRLGIVPHAG